MKQSVVIKIGAFAPNIIIYTGNMGRLNKVKKKESKNVKIKRFRSWFHRGEFIRLDIQSIIMAVFTTLTIVTTIVMGMLRLPVLIYGMPLIIMSRLVLTILKKYGKTKMY